MATISVGDLQVVVKDMFLMVNILLDTHSTTLSVPDINSIIFTKGYCSPEDLNVSNITMMCQN